ncbi:MAG: hypothetical protein E7021_05640 [Alphaproteobacteria bacterium]|nr:hypothetical protein [Alphaproteobacteria bacterium]
MTDYRILYLFKNNPKIVQRFLNQFLLFQIYSPEIIRQAFRRWPEVPEFIRQSTPEDAEDLIESSFMFSEDELKSKINRYYIENAVWVLKNYQNCAVPLTKDPIVKQTQRKLTSKQGDKALKILQKAKEKKQWTDKMAKLAVACSHKFLFDPKYYRQFNITAGLANAMAIPHLDEKANPTGDYRFPAIQLTKGCTNNCSHCCERAEPHLSHMPWPIFTALYDSFNKHYRHYKQEKTDAYFCQFFDDSDMLSYHDPIMGVDSGDVCHWIDARKGYNQILTRGVTDKKSEIALAKATLSNCPISVSFVDTPKENMPHNINQLNKTLDILQRYPPQKKVPIITHLHLASGPSVDDKIFRGFHVEKSPIWALGKGKEFPHHETQHHQDENYEVPFVIRPSGNLDAQKVRNGEIVNETIKCIYHPQKYKKGFFTRIFGR